LIGIVLIYVTLTTGKISSYEDQSTGRTSLSTIHRYCDKIHLQIPLETIARRKLRYPKIILQHALSEFTKLALDDRMICHKIARLCLKTGLHIRRRCSVNQT